MFDDNVTSKHENLGKSIQSKNDVIGYYQFIAPGTDRQSKTTSKGIGILPGCKVQMDGSVPMVTVRHRGTLPSDAEQ